MGTGNYIDYIQALKEKKGKDIICYGGASFISSLIQAALIDEFHLLINPTIIGTGLPIFSEIKQKQKLKLVNAKHFDCGIALLHYTKE